MDYVTTHLRTTHHPFQATGVEGLGHEPEPRFPKSDSRSQSALQAKVLALLQRHAEELLRTSRDTRAQSAAATAAPIVDPWALAGTGPATTAVMPDRLVRCKSFWQSARNCWRSWTALKPIPSIFYHNADARRAMAIAD